MGPEYFIRDAQGNYLAQRRTANQGSALGLYQLWSPEREGALLVSDPEAVIAAEFSATEFALYGIYHEQRTSPAATA